VQRHAARSGIENPKLEIRSSKQIRITTFEENVGFRLFSSFANLPLLRIHRTSLLRRFADAPVSTRKPDLFRARLRRRAMLDSLPDYLAHAIEPPARALCLLLASNDGRTTLGIFDSEFHLLVEHIFTFLFFAKF
jgi:hypothetical protein